MKNEIEEKGYEVDNEDVIDGLRREGEDVKVIGLKWKGNREEEDKDKIVMGEVEVRKEKEGLKRKVWWVIKYLMKGMKVY